MIKEVLKKLDDEYERQMRLASALHKEGLHDYAERFEQYAEGISHAITKMLEALKDDKS